MSDLKRNSDYVKATIRYEDGPLAGQEIQTSIHHEFQVGERVLVGASGFRYVVIAREDGAS